MAEVVAATGRRVGRVAVAFALLAGVVVSAGAAGAGSPGPSISLDPSTGLTHLQEVVVEGTGFPPSGQVFVVQCTAGGHDAASCDVTNVAYAYPDGAGDFRTTAIVRSTIATSTGNHDCSAPDTCDLVAAVGPDGETFAAVPVQVAGPPPEPFPEPTCPAPFAPVGYVRGAVDVPALPPPVAGTEYPYVQFGATVSVVPDGDALLVTVTYGGVTRVFTTAPYAFGGNYDRTPGPSDTPYGPVSMVRSDDGALFVVLAQNNSGDYTRFGWRFDQPCAAVAVEGLNPAFTG